MSVVNTCLIIRGNVSENFCLGVFVTGYTKSKVSRYISAIGIQANIKG